MKLDKFEKKILSILQNNGKLSNAELARKIGLTVPATLERIRKLQKNDFILGYKAILNKKNLGNSLKKFSIREVIRKKSNCFYLTRFKDKVFSKKGVI